MAMRRAGDTVSMPSDALIGRRVVVTGASRGIGREVAGHLAELGARLVLVARDSGRLETVRDSLPRGPHEVAALDVSDEAAWEAVARDVVGREPLHGLVTAAGVLGPVGPVGTWEVADFRRTFEVNVVGTLLPIKALLGALRLGKGSVVTFSGGGATAPLPRFDGYAASKTALVRLTENLAAELGGDGVRVNSVAPGFVATDIHRSTVAAGPELAGTDYWERTRRDLAAGGDSPRMAAELTAFLLSADAEGITGRLVSARWDPWREPTFRQRLRTDPSLGRLRRIEDHFYSAVSRHPA
jgi:NAD(P)-dependent dehydrogenase (short-subunit alcohol dehydrogenase family)